jgi:hypothetical protein
LLPFSFYSSLLHHDMFTFPFHLSLALIFLFVFHLFPPDFSFPHCQSSHLSLSYPPWVECSLLQHEGDIQVPIKVIRLKIMFSPMLDILHISHLCVTSNSQGSLDIIWWLAHCLSQRLCLCKSPTTLLTVHLLFGFSTPFLLILHLFLSLLGTLPPNPKSGV